MPQIRCPHCQRILEVHASYAGKFIACEKCGNTMVMRDGAKRGPWLGCSNYPKCRATKTLGKLTGADLKQAEALIPLLNEESAKSREMVAKVLGANPAAAHPVAAAGAKGYRHPDTSGSRKSLVRRHDRSPQGGDLVRRPS